MFAVLPHNIDAEKAVLGSVLIDAEIMTDFADVLLAEHFYAPAHQMLFQAMLDLYHQNKPIDVLTLTTTLKKAKQLEKIGGASYLSELVAVIPSTAHVAEYMAIVKESATRRQLLRYATKITEQAGDEQQLLEDLLNSFESDLFSMTTESAAKDFLSASELVEKHFERTEEFSKNPNALRGIPTGLSGVDQILGGLHPSDLLIVAARPGVGKSSFAIDIARHAAVEEGKSVAIMALEMPAIQVIERVIAQQINVNMWDLRMARLTDEAYLRLAEGAGKVSSAKLFVDDTPGLGVNQLRSKVRKLKMDQGLDLLIIDYLQLMQGTGKKVDSRAHEVSEITRNLKILARELNIPVVALSQLNRAVENRNDHRPQLSDLRESGSIEQDADIVIFLHREKNYNPETEKPDVIDLIVSKHRNGPVGAVELKFVEHSTKFQDPT